MEALLVVLLALTVVTLVGHGIWVVLSALWRGLGGAVEAPESARGPAERSTRCPGCGAALGDWDRDCPGCGLVCGSGRARRLRDLDVARRQVADLHDRGDLDWATTQHLDQLFARRRAEVLGTPPPPPARPAPSQPAAEVEVVRVLPLPVAPLVAEVLDALPAEPVAAVPVVPAVPPQPRATEGPPVPRPMVVSVVERPPARPITSMLSAFMEERNILWGELVGGLLIVGCSIALVISLWHQLQALPYFPFLLFGLLTAALFFAGQYTLHHWKLASTSRGLLLISLLLVPLNLLVLADPSARGRAPDLPWLDAALGAGALALFTLLVRVAARDLIGTGVLPGPIDRRWLLGLAVVGAAGTQLLTPHLLDEPVGAPPARFLLLACLPLACYLLACGAVLGGLMSYGRRTSRLDVTRANALFAFLGLAAFALFAAFGYLLTRIEVPLVGLHALALPLLLAGLPALAAGMLAQRSLRDPEVAGTRTAGTAVAIAGLGALAAGLALAWPAPIPLLAGLAITAVALFGAATLGRFPWAHAVAVPSAAVGLLIGYHLVVGNLPLPPDVASSPGLLRLLFGAESGAALAVVAAGLAGVATWLWRFRWRVHALALGRCAVAVGGVALLIVTGHGEDHPLTAAAAHAVCAVAGLAASLRWRSAVLPHAAVAVLIPGTLWALSGLAPQREVWGLTIALEALAMTLLALVPVRREDLARAAERVGLFAGALAVLLALATGTFPSHPLHTFTILALTTGALVLALARRDAGWFTGFQAGLAVAVVCAITAWSRGRPDEVWLWRAYGLGLGSLTLALLALRRVCAVSDRLRDLYQTTWPGLDRWLLGGLVLAQLASAGVGGLEALLGEWSATALVSPAPGWDSWALLGVLAAGIGMVLRGPRREDEEVIERTAVVGLALLGGSAALLWAGTHNADRAGASALRWGLAVWFLLGSLLVWLRQPLAGKAEALGFTTPPATAEVRALLACGAGVVVFLTVILAGLGFSGAGRPGPLPGSVFVAMGPVARGIGPLVLVLLGLAGSAVRERAPGYALAAGLLAAVSATGGYALGVVQAGGRLNDGRVMFAALLGCQVSALAGLAWLVGRERIGGGPRLAVQSWLGLAGVTLVAAVAWPDLLSESGLFPLRYRALGGGAGWLALALAAVAAWWHTTVVWPRGRIHVLGLTGLCTWVLVGSFARGWDEPGFWVSYHALAGCGMALAVALVGLGSWFGAARGWPDLLPGREVRGWLTGLVAALLMVALAGAGEAKALTPAGSALAGSVLAGAAALGFRRARFVWMSGCLLPVAGVLVWWGHGPSTASSLLATVAIGLALASAFWSAVEQRRGSAPGGSVAFSALAGPLALALVMAVVGLALLVAARGEQRVPLGGFVWGGLAAVGLALGLALRVRRDQLAAPGLYLLGLTTVGLVLLELPLDLHGLAWAGGLALATFAGLASAAWGLARRYSPAVDREWAWFAPAQTAVAGAALMLALGVALSLPLLWQRLTGPLVALLLVPAALVLAPVGPGRSPRMLRLTSAALGALALALLASAVPDPASAVPWLYRNSWLLAALTLAGLVSLEAQPRWRDGGPLGLGLLGLAVALLPVLLGQMVPLFDPVARRTPLGVAGSAAVALSVLALLATSLRLALYPERDPLTLNEGGRTGYVYLAELLLVLLFVHVRLNIPELFLGKLVQYWTLAVMTIAFIGVGLGEWFERRGLRVLARPLARTGVFLPLVPLLSFWARPPSALLGFANESAPGLMPFLSYLANLPRDYDAHAILWFLAAGLYAALALSRRSFSWALVAALAGNFGLWALLLHAEVGFLAHPQAWLIPLALIILVSEHVNRSRLSAETGQALRYLGISLIYVASTADLFIAGLGSSVWLPIVLAGLCVAGVLAGILLRVRAFLFLGVGFLLVDVLTMIYHAAVHQAHTWLWWASGIVLGVAILALFAVFEKRRNDVLALLDELRQWD